MKRFILLQLFQMIVTLLILSMIIFGLVRLSGDPALLLLPESATKADYKQMRVSLGLDRPIYVQYGIFVRNAIKGDFGTSVYTKRQVADSIKEALPNSFKLVIPAALVAFLLGIPFGVIAAVKKGSYQDVIARFIAGLGQSLPVFWVGLMIMQLFSIEIRLLPTSGMGTWKHYLMPGFCVTFFMIPGIIRLVRASMLESLDKDYITLARIKGVSERVIVWKHALRNSLLPVLSYGGMQLAIMITGSILIETVFAWPGIGRLAYRSIVTQDFPLIQGVVLTMAGLVITVNLLVDILYGYADPRIRSKAK